MEDSRVDIIEVQLKEFLKKREEIGQEIVDLQTETKQIIDKIFGEVLKGLESHSEKFDEQLDSHVSSIRALVSKKESLEKMKRKLAPVLDLFKESSRV